MRTTFVTSRMMDFFNRKELTAQTGYPPRDWVVYVCKELIDNAIDACEEAGVAPEIEVKVTSTSIAVSDNGPGIPTSTIEGVLDFSSRVSSREAYIAPDRGAQGNALKTVLAIPFVLDGERGQVTIEAAGVKHRIAIQVDEIRQEPVIDYRTGPSRRKTGTRVLVHWPADSACSEPRRRAQFLQNDEGDHEEAADPDTDSACSLEGSKRRFLQISSDFTWLNPHLDLVLRWDGKKVLDVRPTDPEWSKWRPSHPTSPHWYDSQQLGRLAAAYIAHDQGNGRVRLVREFICGFDGLTSTGKQKRVLDALDLHREPLTVLTNGTGLDDARVSALLASMQTHSKPVTHRRLGSIGEAHIHQRFEALGAKMDTFKYKRVLDIADGRPEILEVAFAWCPKLGEDRRFLTGVNWSPGIVNPFRRLGETGETLDSYLADLRCGVGEEVVIFMHLATPLAQYTDHGKSAIVMTGGSS